MNRVKAGLLIVGSCIIWFLPIAARAQSISHTEPNAPFKFVIPPTAESKSSHNAANFLKAIGRIQAGRYQAWRVLYQAACERGGIDAIPFPRVESSRQSNGNDTLSLLPHILKSKQRITVSKADSGVPRISVGNPSASILATKLARISLTPNEQYDPNSAIYAVEGSPEIRDAEKRLGLSMPQLVLLGSIRPIEPGKPRLPKHLANITLDDLLDLVVRTFGGVIFYGECADPSNAHLYVLYHTDL
jgi:hypothetical protein